MVASRRAAFDRLFDTNVFKAHCLRPPRQQASLRHSAFATNGFPQLNMLAHTKCNKTGVPTNLLGIPIGHKVNVKPKSSLIERWGLQAGGRQALHLKQLVPFFLKAPVLAATIASLGGCSSVIYDVRTSNEVRTGTVKPATLRQMESQNIDRAAPVLIRIYKEERILEVWKQTRTGKFALLNSYPICKFSGTLGPKMAQGDRQAPEGFYDITTDQMNSQSSEYLSFNVGFPNALDRSLGRTGSFSYGARRLQVGWVLRHDGLSNGRDLRSR